MQPTDSVHTGQRVGLVMAAAMTPPTLAPSLSKRSWQDQGIITGLSTGSHYLLTLAAQDLIDVAAAFAARHRSPFPESWSEARRRSVAALASELGGIAVGLGLAAYLDRGGVSTPGRGLRCARRPGGWARRPCAGACLIGATAGAQALDRAVGADGRLAALPLSIPVGLLTSAVIERACAAPEPTTEAGPGARRGRRRADRAGPRRRWRPCSRCSRGRLGRAVDGRAGAPARARADSRLRPRLAGSPRTRPSPPAPAWSSAPCGRRAMQRIEAVHDHRGPVDAAPRPAYGRTR